MQLKSGTRLKSMACETEVIVVRGPSSVVSLECGGHPMVSLEEKPVPRMSVDPAHARGTLLGKRYGDETLGLEVLCTTSGAGSLSIDGCPLPLRVAKPLPSSD